MPRHSKVGTAQASAARAAVEKARKARAKRMAPMSVTPRAPGLAELGRGSLVEEHGRVGVAPQGGCRTGLGDRAFEGGLDRGGLALTVDEHEGAGHAEEEGDGQRE